MTVRDAPLLYRSINHFDVLRMTATWAWPIDEAYVARRISEPRAPGAHASTFGIAPATYPPRVIGSIGGAYNTRTGDFTIGYMLAPDCAGRGLATEALIAVCRHFFLTVRPPYIVGERYADNPASGRVMEKAGFRHVGPAAPAWSQARQRHFPGEAYRLDPRANVAAFFRQSR